MSYLCTRNSAMKCKRGVAQPGSAPVLGTGGRRFESCRPDCNVKYNVLVSNTLYFRLWTILFSRKTVRRMLSLRRSVTSGTAGLSEKKS